MKYDRKILLKNGAEAQLRNADAADGEVVFDIFQKTHAETDYLRSYPDETTFTPEEEAVFLAKRAESPNEVMLLAVVDGKAVGTAGIDAIGPKYKERHRVGFGISVLKEFWGLGLGRALTEACIECAKEAGYTQLELEVVAENERAVSLYQKMGFTEFGRNPRGFRSRISGDQELIYMLRAL